MFEYRQIIVRMRLGDSDRALARAGLIGRPKARALRQIAQQQGWLDTNQPLPYDEVLAQFLKQPRQESSAAFGSSVEPYRDVVVQWVTNDMQAKTIYQSLIRNHRFSGSYASVYRFVRSLKPMPPDAIMHRDFEPVESAQVNFGTGPRLADTRIGEVFKTWFLLMILCWSRHQYAELVLNQKIDTWWNCHRHTFEWFNGVPGRTIIDNAKCAITRACIHDPQVQRAYVECAEGYGFKIDTCLFTSPAPKERPRGIGYQISQAQFYLMER